MRYKTQFVTILLIALSLTACRRGRLSQSVDTTAPTQVESAQTAAVPVKQPTATQSPVVESATSVDVAILPLPIPSLTPVPSTTAADLSGDLSQLDGILNDLDQILGETKTDVNIP
jgi:hypothetical protein